MTALLLTLAAFAAWWLIGLAVLSLVRADIASLRIVLTAPLLGSAVTVLPLFVVSHAGATMEQGALPVFVGLLTASIVVLAVRRPRMPLAVASVLAVCVAELLFVGRPMFRFGFSWISNANDDMANYVLLATQLLNHGLLAPTDLVGLTHDRNFATALQQLHDAGSRPGADLLLAGLSSVTGLEPYHVFMPLILSLHLGMICGAAALAMQATRRWWAAPVAAALVVASPLATFGVLQQLMPQVWGLGLAAAFFALLMRPELHDLPGPRVSDLVLIGVLTTTLILVYVELASMLVVIYGLYVVVLAIQRHLKVRSLALLWGVPLACAAVILNTYLFRELEFVLRQAKAGVGGAGNGVFSYTLVPSALPGLTGLRVLPPGAGARLLEASILISIALLAALALGSLWTARRGVAASVILLGDFALGAFLALNESDFGLFKLYMYVQPFVAAAIAAWLAYLTRRSVLAIVAALVAVTAGIQLTTKNVYVSRSYNPIDLRHASDPDLLPAFRHAFARTDTPVIAVTENPTLAKLEAASVGDRPLYLISSNIFAGFVDSALGEWPVEDPRRKKLLKRLDFWKERKFDPLLPGAKQIDFGDNTRASRLLAAGRCVLALPSGSLVPLNRTAMPEGSSKLVMKKCSDARNVLVFTVSSVGQSFYGFSRRDRVSFYQLENDVFFRGKSFAGLGRYALFRVLNPSPKIRLKVVFTKTLRQDGSNRLPSVVAVGDTRARFPIVGRGSARIFSPPLRPQIIGGQPYVLLDMGENGKILSPPRSGVLGLYKREVPLDPRYLTSYVRDISLVTDAQYRARAAPLGVRDFPEDLLDGDLEYSGIYEDGWVAEDLYAVLAGGRTANLLLRADVLPRQGQRLQMLVNGHQVFNRRVKEGRLELIVPLPPSDTRRRVELRWDGAMRLGDPDRRQAAARLRFLGLVPTPLALRRLPAALATPGLKYSGIYKDGWLERDSYVILAGGKAANLLVRAQALPRAQGQRLRVFVNGRGVAFQSVPPGELEVQVPITASRSPRRVELKWAGTVPLRAPDTRQAAARLTFLGVAEAPSEVGRLPAALKDPGLVYSGIFEDGWLEKDAELVLAGGEASNLILQARVPPRDGGQRLRVLVNGRQVASRKVSAGQLVFRVPVAASRTTRRIELRWAGTVRLRPPDRRDAAALLEAIRVVPSGVALTP